MGGFCVRAVQAVAIGAAWAWATGALAEPVTYAGKLGKSDVVVELTHDPAATDEPLAGRYFYRSQGADIPLQAGGLKDGAFELTEEEACGAEKCGEGQKPPTAATWRLKPGDEGRTLAGSWIGKKTLPLKLERVGGREGEPAETPYDLYNFTDMTFFSGEIAVTMNASPYDYLRLDAPLEEGKVEGWPGASFRYVIDPRTKFARPRIVDIAGSSADAANVLLKNRHWVDNLAALGCKALQYAGFYEGGRPFSGSDEGSLGGYDETSSEVTALTPRLMSWRDSGSVYCGGAHPSNYSNAYVMDVPRGTLLDLGDMFDDVVDGKPGPKLLRFVKERREKPTDQTTIDFEAECGTEELIGDYLATSLKREGDTLTLVFGLQGLPHVINACGDDVLAIPAKEAAALMTEEFREMAGE